MKKIFVICVICGFFSGCASSGSDSDLVRRARVVANENMQLKKQFSDLNNKIDSQSKQIADLTKELEQSKQQAADLQTRYNELEKNLNAALQDCQNALAESQQAAAPVESAVSCEELEQQYAELFESLMRQLLECSQKLEEYERKTTETPK